MKNVALSNKQVQIILHVLFWTTVLLLPLLYRTDGVPYAKIGGLPVPFFYFSSAICIGLFYFNAFFLYPRFCNKKYWWLFLLSLLVLFATVNHLKITTLQYWFPMVSIFGANARFIFAPTFMAILASTVYRFVANRIHSEKMLRQKEAEQLTMELKFLRSQINPHFLFNVLSSLVSLARKKSDQLEPSLIILSDMMRYMLYDSNDKKVPLEEELSYLKSFIALQQIRFGDSIRIESNIEMDDESKKFLIEPMLLIPFVENAFKHGAGWREGAFINIRLILKEKILTFITENKINNADNHKDEGTGIGLTNVKSRLKLLYPHRHQLIIKEKKGTFHVHLSIELQ